MADHDIRPSGSFNPPPIDMPDDFVPIEDAYEEVFRLYTEGDPFSWRHNRAVSQQIGSIEIELQVNSRPTTITLHQDLSLLSHPGITGTVLWDSSVFLARLFPSLFPLNRATTRVLELGSGCGLMGLALAPLAAHVTCTDQPEMLPLLLKNMKRNLSERDAEGVQIAELVWGERIDREILGDKWDYIIACDCVYNEHIISKFVRTVWEVCTASDIVRVSEVKEEKQAVEEQRVRTKTVVVVAQELRSDTVHLAFLEEMTVRGFEMWRMGGERLGEFARGYVIYVAWLSLIRLWEGEEEDGGGGGEFYAD